MSNSSRVHSTDTRSVDVGTIYFWPRFRDETMRKSYQEFSDNLPRGAVETITTVMFYLSLLVKLVSSVSRLASGNISGFSYGILVVTAVLICTCFILRVCYVAAGWFGMRGNWKYSLLRWNIMVGVLGYLAHFLYQGLNKCTTLRGFAETCNEIDTVPVIILTLSVVVSFAFYILVKNFDLAMLVVTIVLVVQLVTIAQYGFTFDLVLIVVMLLLLTIAALYIMERSLMAAFVGTFHQKRLMDIERNLLETEKKQLRSVLWNVAHDMKTPLQSFVAGMHVMQENPQKIRQLLAPSPDFKLKRDVEGVLRESFSAVQEMSASYELLMMQLNRAMDVVSLENDLQTSKPEISVSSIKEVLSDAVSVITTLQCNKTKIQIGRLPDNLPTHIMTARTWLSDNLLCTLSNAVKYSPTQSTVHVDLSVQTFEEVLGLKASNLRHGDDLSKEDKLLVIKVTDAGIAEVNHERMFSSFTQSNRFTGGAGLGLYALSLRMKRLGGACGSYYRQDGTHGSVFFIAVPYAPVSTVKEKKWELSEICSDNHENVSRSAVSSGNATTMLDFEDEQTHAEGVLVVDDSMPTLKLMARAFKNAGLHVTTATDGKQALEEMKQKLYAIVLMDIQMPVMDGLESISLFREWEKSAAARQNTRQTIVALSAVAAYRDEAMMAGADGFENKPVNVKSFIAAYRIGGNSV